jgi:hypothetical protein
MDCTIAHHTSILAVQPICVNFRISQFLSVVGFPILFTLRFELPIMEQEVGTALMLGQFGSNNFSFHNSFQFQVLYWFIYFVSNF